MHEFVAEGAVSSYKERPLYEVESLLSAYSPGFVMYIGRRRITPQYLRGLCAFD